MLFETSKRQPHVNIATLAKTRQFNLEKTSNSCENKNSSSKTLRSVFEVHCCMVNNFQTTLQGRQLSPETVANQPSLSPSKTDIGEQHRHRAYN